MKKQQMFFINYRTFKTLHPGKFVTPAKAELGIPTYINEEKCYNN